MKQATLLYLIKDGQILLGYKKRGFGEGRWNGYGGKVEEGETLEDAACREMREESGVLVDRSHLKKYAVIDFYFTNAPAGKVWDQTVHVYVADTWQGDPTETEEMRPEWFAFKEAPIHLMWQDDPYWLPLVIDGIKIKASFTFGEDNAKVIKHRIDLVAGL